MKKKTTFIKRRVYDSVCCYIRDLISNKNAFFIQQV